MAMGEPKKILNAEETREAVLEWFEDDNDWVVLGYIVDEVGYDQLTVSPKELQDVIDKIVAAEDLQLYHATRPSDSEFKGLFGGNPIPLRWIPKRSVNTSFAQTEWGYSQQ